MNQNTKPLTFRELQEQEQPTAARFLKTLANYVETGSAISYSAVIEVAKRVNLSEGQRATAREYLGFGYLDQMERGESKAAKEYQLAKARI